MSKILFSPREDEIHMFKTPCNVLFIIYSRKQFEVFMKRNFLPQFFDFIRKVS